MTRKRFVKLLMGHKWYDRNTANRIAYYVTIVADANYKNMYEAVHDWDTVEYWN